MAQCRAPSQDSWPSFHLLVHASHTVSHLLSVLSPCSLLSPTSSSSTSLSSLSLIHAWGLLRLCSFCSHPTSQSLDSSPQGNPWANIYWSDYDVDNDNPLLWSKKMHAKWIVEVSFLTLWRLRQENCGFRLAWAGQHSQILFHIKKKKKKNPQKPKTKDTTKLLLFLRQRQYKAVWSWWVGHLWLKERGRFSRWWVGFEVFQLELNEEKEGRLQMAAGPWPVLSQTVASDCLV